MTCLGASLAAANSSGRRRRRIRQRPPVRRLRWRFIRGQLHPNLGSSAASLAQVLTTDDAVPGSYSSPPLTRHRRSPTDSQSPAPPLPAARAQQGGLPAVREHLPHFRVRRRLRNRDRDAARRGTAHRSGAIEGKEVMSMIRRPLWSREAARTERAAIQGGWGPTIRLVVIRVVAPTTVSLGTVTYAVERLLR